MAFVLLVAVLGLASWRLLAPRTVAERCDIGSGPCRLVLGDQPVEVETAPQHPRAESEFTLRLRFDPEVSSRLLAEEVTVHFSMIGMDMGRNVMSLTETGAGTLEGRIALPTCPMGQGRWRASIRVGVSPAGELDLYVGS